MGRDVILFSLKNPLKISAHISSSIPPVTSTRWLSLSSCSSL